MKKLSTASQRPDSETESINPTAKPKSKRLSQMKSMKKLTTKLKLNGQIDEFLEVEVEKLNVENADEVLYLNTVVLKEVMQSAERHFVYGSKAEREEMKRDAVLQLLGRFFDDNEDVLDRFREIVYKKVSKYGFTRRVLVRLYNSIFKKRKA